ncbi:MAG: hypothetical protein WDO19_13860 [Bacteroidota bacterium]
MSEKDIKRLEDLAKNKLQKGVSKEEALRSLQQAGILDKKGDFTSPYKNLARIVTEKK